MGLFGPVGDILEKLGLQESEEEKRRREEQERLSSGARPATPGEINEAAVLQRLAETAGNGLPPSGVALPPSQYQAPDLSQTIDPTTGHPVGNTPITDEERGFLQNIPQEFRLHALIAKDAGVPWGSQFVDPGSGEFNLPPLSPEYIDEEVAPKIGPPAVGDTINFLGRDIELLDDRGVLRSFVDGTDFPKFYARDVETGNSKVYTLDPADVVQHGSSKRLLADNENSYTARVKGETAIRNQIEEYLQSLGTLAPGEPLDDDSFVAFLVGSGYAPVEPGGNFIRDGDIEVNAPREFLTEEGVVQTDPTGTGDFRQAFAYPSNERLAWQAIAEEDKLANEKLLVRDFFDLGLKEKVENLTDLGFDTIRATASVPLLPLTLATSGLDRLGVIDDPLPPGIRTHTALHNVVKGLGAEVGDAVDVAIIADRYIGTAVAGYLAHLEDDLGADTIGLRDLMTHRIAGEEIAHRANIELAGLAVGAVIPFYGVGGLRPSSIKAGVLTAGRTLKAAANLVSLARGSHAVAQSSKPTLGTLRSIQISRAFVPTIGKQKPKNWLQIDPDTYLDSSTGKLKDRVLHVDMDLDYIGRVLANADNILAAAKNPADKAQRGLQLDYLRVLVEARGRGILTSNRVTNPTAAKALSALVTTKKADREEFIRLTEEFRKLEGENARMRVANEEVGASIFDELVEEGKSPGDAYRAVAQILKPEGNARPLLGSTGPGGTARHGWLHFAAKKVASLQNKAARKIKVRGFEGKIKKAQDELVLQQEELARLQFASESTSESAAIKIEREGVLRQIGENEARIKTAEKELGSSDQLISRVASMEDEIATLQGHIQRGVIRTKGKDSKKKLRPAKDNDIRRMEGQITQLKEDRDALKLKAGEFFDIEEAPAVEAISLKGIKKPGGSFGLKPHKGMNIEDAKNNVRVTQNEINRMEEVGVVTDKQEERLTQLASYRDEMTNAIDDAEVAVTAAARDIKVTPKKSVPELDAARDLRKDLEKALAELDARDVPAEDPKLVEKAKKRMANAKERFDEALEAAIVSGADITELPFLRKAFNDAGIPREWWDLQVKSNVVKIRAHFNRIMGPKAPAPAEAVGNEAVRLKKQQVVGLQTNIKNRQDEMRALIKEVAENTAHPENAMVSYLNSQNFTLEGNVVEFLSGDINFSEFVMRVTGPGGRQHIRSISGDELSRLRFQKRVVTEEPSNALDIHAIATGASLPEAEKLAAEMVDLETKERQLNHLITKIRRAGLQTLTDEEGEQLVKWAPVAGREALTAAPGPAADAARADLVTTLTQVQDGVTGGLGEAAAALERSQVLAGKLRRANMTTALDITREQMNALNAKMAETDHAILTLTNPDVAENSYHYVNVVDEAGKVKKVREPIYNLKAEFYKWELPSGEAAEEGAVGAFKVVDKSKLGAIAKEQLENAEGIVQFMTKPVAVTGGKIASEEKVAQHFSVIRSVLSDYTSRVGYIDEMYLPEGDTLLNRMLLSADSRREVMATLVKTDLGRIDAVSATKIGLGGKLGFIRRVVGGNVLDKWGQAAHQSIENLRMAAEFQYELTFSLYNHNLNRIADALAIPGNTQQQRVGNLFRRGFKSDEFRKFILGGGDKETLLTIDNLPVVNGERIVPQSIVDAFSTDSFAYMLHPEFWDKKLVPEEVQLMTEVIARDYDNLRGALEIEGISLKDEGILNHILEPSLRDSKGVTPADNLIQLMVNTETLLKDYSTFEKRKASLLKTRSGGIKDDFLHIRSFIGEVDEAGNPLMDEIGNRVVLPLSRMLRSGQDQLGGVMATMNRRLISRNFVKNVYDKYVPDKKQYNSLSKVFTFSSDGTFQFAKGGEIAIKAPEGATKEVAKQFQGIRDDMGHLVNLSGGTELGLMGKAGEWMANVSKNIAMGRLIADASILGVQTSMYLSLQLVNPKKWPAFVTNAWKLTGDEEWMTWLSGNADEIGLYMRRGFRVGTQAFIGGEFQPSWWLEHTPLVGGIGRLVSNANDIQFTRWLSYMKVEAIRQHMQVWNMASKHPSIFGQFLKDVDGVQRADEMLGGKYLSSTKDEVLEAVIRLTNNQFGGLPKYQYGAGAWRELAERILLIVPGFFRARSGLIATALSRPHTLEGIMSSSIMARELAFSATASYTVSMLFGKEDEWFENFQKGPQAGATQWLAALGPDFSVSTMPNAAPLTAFSRLLTGGQTFSDMASGEWDRFIDPLARMRSLTTAWESRMSPMTSGIYQAIKGEDFLGRRYDSNYENILAQAQIFSPIFVEQAISSVRESGGNINQIGVQSFTEFLGRSYRPKSPLQHLNDITEGTFPGEEWRALDSAQKDALRMSDPEVEEWETKFHAELAERDSDVERVQGSILDSIGNIPETMMKRPVTIGGTRSSQEEDDVLYQAGALPADEWLTRFQARQKMVGAEYDLYDNVLVENFGAESFEEFMEKKDEEFGDKERADTWALMRSLSKLNLEDEAYQKVVLVTTNDGQKYPLTVLDYDAFAIAETALYEAYPQDVQDEVRYRLRVNDSPARTDYRLSNEQLDGFLQIPKYSGMSIEDGEQMDGYRITMAEAVRKIRSLGIDSKNLKADDIRSILLRDLVKYGMIQTERDVQIALLAWELETSSNLAEEVENPARIRYALDNQEMIAFYPWTRSVIPSDIQGFLNENIRPSINTERLTNPDNPFN